MINLLPPDMKKGYRYAERNVSMRRWAIAAFTGLIGVGIIATYGWLSIHQSQVSYDGQIVSSQNILQKEKLTQTDAKVHTITGSFRLAVKVLGQEVLFSQLLKQMAVVLPAGANLTTLNIESVQSGSGLDITADATNYTTATQVEVNLADPANKIFAKADINNITCNAASSQNPLYPCTVSIRAQFAQNNPFLFINQQGSKS